MIYLTRNPMWKKSGKQKGFTLTEVMISMVILVTTVVSATNILMGFIDSNKSTLKSLQAYYLAMEGLETVRNIRDTNWLHNLDWLGEDSDAVWGQGFKTGEKYIIGMKKSFAVTQKSDNYDIRSLLPFAPFGVQSAVMETDGKIYKNKEGDTFYMSSDAIASDNTTDTGFSRIIYIEPYDGDCTSDTCADFAHVRSVVYWDGGNKKTELETVLTNWKGGAL